jgi:hypothetical protein
MRRSLTEDEDPLPSSCAPSSSPPTLSFSKQLWLLLFLLIFELVGVQGPKDHRDQMELKRIVRDSPLLCLWIWLWHLWCFPLPRNLTVFHQQD